MKSVNDSTGKGDSDDRPPSQAGGIAICPRPTAADAPSFAALMERPEWEDWHWQMRRRIRTLAQLQRLFPDLPTSLGTAAAIERFPMAITPYYASLIRDADERDPILQMCVPQGRECFDPPYLCSDPLMEDEDMPVPGLVHRYDDRALVLATTVCGSYCRHCTRKRIAGHRESTVTSANLKQMRSYLEAHPEIHDVIVSGGDPFTMETAALEAVLHTVRSVPTVDVIRVGTRCPVVMPMRITDELAAMLRRYHPLYVNTHFNHPAELTPRSIEACERLADAGIPVGNQSVLLRGINDSPQTMETLLRGLLRIRVRPYYLYQCDLVRGVEHFRTPLSRGIEIMEYLRGRLSGLAIPTFVVDAPHGGGKIPVLPNYVVSTSPTHTVLRNFEGTLVAYPEPSDTAWAASDNDKPTDSAGVWHLASGNALHVAPSHGGRRKQQNAS